MDKIKKTVAFTITNPLDASIAACCYIVTCAIAIWGVMFAFKIARAIVLGY